MGWWSVYVVGMFVCIVAFKRAADQRVGRTRAATRSPLRQGMKLWLLVPFMAAWPIALVCRSWLLDRYLDWRYEADPDAA